MSMAENLLSGVDLNLLLALERLLATGHVGKAAAELGVSQPAMSRQLERLRGLLGDPLLVRVGRGMVLTARAEALLPLARTALEAVHAALRPPAPFNPLVAQGSFHLAIPDDVLAAVVLPLMEHLRTAAPRLDVRVRAMTRASLEALTRGTLDVAVLPDVRGMPGLNAPDLSEFVVQPLFTDRFVVVAARRIPRLTVQAWAARDHVLVTPAGESERGIVDGLLAREGLSRRVALTVPSFQQAALVVASSDLVATLPERAARLSGVPLALHPPPLPMPPLPMNLVWHPRTTTSARHRFIRDALKASVAA
jgi:DNA-binding transcriptional LysR family regulator